MTLLEISNRISYKVWGDPTASPPPASASAILPDLILEAWRKIQIDYNYWFMKSSATISTVAGTTLYNLPTNFKEIISCYFQIYGQTYYGQPLVPIDDAGANKYLSYNTQIEYPESFQIADEQIKLFPAPSGIRTLTVNYWKFLTEPTTFNTHEDDLTIYGYKAIVNFCVAELKADLEGFQESNFYTAKYEEAIADLKREDYRRRQSALSDINYNGV